MERTEIISLVNKYIEGQEPEKRSTLRSVKNDLVEVIELAQEKEALHSLWSDEDLMWDPPGCFQC